MVSVQFKLSLCFHQTCTFTLRLVFDLQMNMSKTNHILHFTQNNQNLEKCRHTLKTEIKVYSMSEHLF